MRRVGRTIVLVARREINRTDWFPMDLWREMGDLGVFRITVNEE